MMVPLHLSDRIQVVAGSHRGLWGYVSDTQDDGTVTFASDAETPLLQVLVQEVWKLFHLGDSIQALYGEHRGAEGFIVGMGKLSAIIYTPNVKYSNTYTQHQHPGNEVRSDLYILVSMVTMFSLHRYR